MPSVAPRAPRRPSSGGRSWPLTDPETLLAIMAERCSTGPARRRHPPLPPRHGADPDPEHRPDPAPPATTRAAVRPRPGRCLAGVTAVDAASRTRYRWPGRWSIPDRRARHRRPEPVASARTGGPRRPQRRPRARPAKLDVRGRRGLTRWRCAVPGTADRRTPAVHPPRWCPTVPWSRVRHHRREPRDQPGSPPTSRPKGDTIAQSSREHDADTGSPEVQIALADDRISHLAEAPGRCTRRTTYLAGAVLRCWSAEAPETAPRPPQESTTSSATGPRHRRALEARLLNRSPQPTDCVRYRAADSGRCRQTPSRDSSGGRSIVPEGPHRVAWCQHTCGQAGQLPAADLRPSPADPRGRRGLCGPPSHPDPVCPVVTTPGSAGPAGARTTGNWPRCTGTPCRGAEGGPWPNHTCRRADRRRRQRPSSPETGKLGVGLAGGAVMAGMGTPASLRLRTPAPSTSKYGSNSPSR